MKARMMLLAAAGAVGLAGCAPMTFVASNPGMTQEQFREDSAECNLAARGLSSGSYANGAAFATHQDYEAANISNLGAALAQRSDFRECMIADGWRPSGR